MAGALLQVLSTQVPIQAHGPPLELVDVAVHYRTVVIPPHVAGFAMHPLPEAATMHPVKYVLQRVLLT